MTNFKDSSSEFGHVTDISSRESSSESPPCILCGSTNYFVKYDFGKPKIMRCRDCTFMWLHPKPNLDDLKEVYNVNYFANKKFLENENDKLYGYYDYLSERFIKQTNYIGLIEELIELLGSFQPGKSKLLDVGCGMGYLMDVAHDKGFQVDGVEFNADAVEKLRSKYAFTAAVGDFIEFEPAGFDVLTMMDLIEHFLDPVVAAEHANRRLRMGGIMALVTMDCDSWTSRLFGKRLEDFRRVREHVSFFNRKTIRVLLERAGFEILDIRFHGHTFRLTDLAERISLVWKPLGKVIVGLVKLLRLDSVPVHINPHLKMILFLRKCREI